MTHSAKTFDRTAGNPAGLVIFGFLGAGAAALLTLVAGHGLLLAFLAYSLSGAVFLVGGAVGRQAIGAAAARLAPAADAGPFGRTA